MTSYFDDSWADVPGREIPVEWKGATVQAWCPAPIAKRELTIDTRVAHACDEAARAVVSTGELIEAPPAGLALLLLRSEAIASSRVEAISAPVEQTLFAALAEEGSNTNDVAARLVAANCAAVARVVADAASGEPLTVDLMNDWHRLLMSDDPNLAEQHVGHVRAEQGWIGGTDPRDAVAVTPPPELLDELLDDLCDFANHRQMNVVTLAALAHVQFELIHPYADGNGRIGRLLVAWLLTRRLKLQTPPPLSTEIAADRGGCLSGIALYRLGRIDMWVRWFADALRGSAERAGTIARDHREVTRHWAELAGKRRRGSAAAGLADVLARQPVLDARIAAKRLGKSQAVARTALLEFEALGIVEQFRPDERTIGRPRHWWRAPAAIDVLRRALDD
ncbi:MAG TPA: hypothetical protein DEP66_01770 [Acidimicrobiaceae bacterium]|nr:hypothetical protein [Acidimicrobiaceae bacterium]HCB36966.1 hypothetical protein [Acidimicrobiaceae bacterium]